MMHIPCIRTGAFKVRLGFKRVITMQYTTTRESVPCECGGRRSNIPDVVRRHNETKKHLNWLFQRLSQEAANTENKGERVACILQMREMVRSGLVE